MAIGNLNPQATAVRRRASESLALRALKFAGSLKITVAMFGLGILVILFGTLAQDEMDLAGVKREYFTCWIASVPIDVLFPITLFPHDSPYMGGFGFYFPGGATIGLVLLINLIAAKTTRFSVQAKGSKLWLGILVGLLGAGLLTAVIVSGHATDGLQGQPPISYDLLWGLLKGGVVVVSLALVGYTIAGRMPRLARILVGVTAAIAVALSAVILRGGESVRLDDPGLRIVWQLLQASIASCVALAGLWMIFGRRGGNVLIHAGVGLLMVGQFVFGDRQVEQRVGMAEGTATNLAVIEDEIEIVLIDTSDPKEDTVYALPEALIRKASKTDGVIDDPSLPCKVRIVEWMKNSDLEPLDESAENRATAGFGLQAVAKPLKPVGAAIMDSVNISSAYVQLIDADDERPIGTYLLSQEINDIAQLTAAMQEDRYEQLEIAGRPFEMAIRYRQIRKPYDVYLKDVERINYSGTETPRDYSSRIVITDRETGESQEDKAWMNNPIRYRGETFYQSRYNRIPAGEGQFIETTGLQVVENAGWMIPYVCCMMVFWGMFAHFGGTFARFAGRYQRGSISAAQSEKADARNGWLGRGLVAASSLSLCVVVAGYFAKPTNYNRDEIDWNAVSQLPVQHEGRIKSFDAVARNVLQYISKPIFGSVPYVKDAADEKRLPSEWLLGVMTGQDWVRDAQIFRIYAPEVRNFLDLEPRKGYRYAYSEIDPKMKEFEQEIAPLRSKDSDNYTFREQKFAALHSQLNLYHLVSLSYVEPPLPSPAGIESEEQRDQFIGQVMRVFDTMQQLESGGPPAVIPPTGELNERNLVDAKWQAYGPALFAEILSPMMGLTERAENKAVERFAAIISAVRDDDVPAANRAVRQYRETLAGFPLAKVHLPKAAAESWLIKFDPTAQGVLLYLLAILLGFASFLVRWDGLRRATFWLLVGIFVIHTIAIVSRIYISGRAPVINLYSSAVFIGWACVMLGLVLEMIYPIGVANLVSGLIGISTLSVARFLDTSDTLPVLQAVLDTQFWLSTHVITVTAGYAVTFLAGFIGICALVHRMATRFDAYPPGGQPQKDREFQQILYRMSYGVICFAIFFSFIGTVLGGLWADDSWGRFWGWDPKENGAMMIVLWNAILLHARWDKQVGPRGFAALAVFGNVVTAWSWFGTNQLGIGLHSYGFTSGALYGLIGFISIHILFVAVSLLVTQMLSAASKGRSGST